MSIFLVIGAIMNFMAAAFTLADNDERNLRVYCNYLRMSGWSFILVWAFVYAL